MMLNLKSYVNEIARSGFTLYASNAYAAIISKETDIDLNVEFDLREWQPDLSFNFDNMQLLKELTDDYDRHNGIHPEGQTPVWETKEMMKNRIEGVLEKYKHYSKVIVVGHGMIFRTLVDCEDIPNCSVFEIKK
jgi:broad specificity phosphatase PhoE